MSEQKLHHRLYKLREKAKLSQLALAKKLGIPRTTYTGYESGAREPDVSMLNKISNLFEVSVDWITTGRDFPYETPLDLSQEEFVLREMVDKYKINLDEPGTKEKLERLIQLVFVDMKGQ